MRLRYALTSACGGVALLVSVQASAATYIGPAFPAPGGTTFSTNGVLAINPGRVATYQGFDLSASDDLYFGITSAGLAMDGSIDSSLETLVFNAALSDLANGIAVYSGQTTVNNAGNNQTVYTRLLLTFADLSTSNPLALTLDPNIGGGLFPVLDVQGSYTVGQSFLASNTLNGTYTAAGPYFGTLQTPNIPQLLRSSLSGGFYYTENSAVPEPGTWALMLFGFGATGFVLRRSRKAQLRLAQIA